MRVNVSGRERVGGKERGESEGEGDENAEAEGRSGGERRVSGSNTLLTVCRLVRMVIDRVVEREMRRTCWEVERES